MSTLITCPNCKTQFEPESAIAQSVEDRVRKEFNQKWADLTKQNEEQYKQKELELQRERRQFIAKVEEDKKALESNLRSEMEKRVGADYENKLRLLEDNNKTNEAKLKEARDKEMEFLQKMQELKTREQEMEIATQRRLVEERTRLEEVIKKSEEEKNRLKSDEYEMKQKELVKQLEDQKKLIEEMRRKSEQGSMQLQGEVQELALEALLRNAFPFDLITEVGKGVKGADCVMTVRNGFGQECGRIIFESKRTKDFSLEWIGKLKADMRVLSADVAVLVTQALPKEMENFGEREGVWVCNFRETKALVSVLRDLVIKVYTAKKSQENKGDKMTLLYNYLISGEFSDQWTAIREGFMGMKISIQREKDQMEKLWKTREKQLERVLLSTAHIKGSIEGIAGMDVDLELLPDENNFLIE